jgi:hypothetical protein
MTRFKPSKREIYPSYEAQLASLRVEEQADLAISHIPMTGPQLDAVHDLRADIDRNALQLLVDKQMYGNCYMDSTGQHISFVSLKPGDVMANDTGETLGPDTDPWQHGDRRVVTGVLRRDISNQHDAYIHTAPATHG